MNRRMHRILIGLAVATLLPASAPAQKVTYDFGTANFSGIRTFAIRDVPDDTKTESTTAYDSPFVEQRTHAAIAAQLEARGMRRDNAHPDMYVTTRRAFKTEYETYAPVDWGLGYAYGWGWGPYYTGWGPWYGGGTWYTEERITGTLIVDFENAATGQLIWRGMAERHVHPMASASHRDKRVNQEVTKIFEKFPAVVPVATAGQDVPRPTGR
ncbi:MAG TPA: DUF4136 domain-containing protein [Vicinamibacterales bacterium]|nr:DUF4136 domain-containing protein [Vicinamibacterales bacterium]